MKITFCILPFWCVPNLTLFRFDHDWWVKTGLAKGNHTKYSMEIFPRTHRLVVIDRKDSIFLNKTQKSAIIQEFTLPDDPF